MLKQRLLIVSLLLLFCLSGCSTSRDISPSSSAAPGLKENTQPSNTEPSQDAPLSKPSMPGKKGDPWILPDSQVHIYTSQELQGLTKEELRLARNEIYARRGRKFKAADLAAYFSQKEWYLPTVEADAFDEEQLSPEEIRNLNTLKQMEEAYGLNVVTCPKIGMEQFPKLDGSTATLPISMAIYRLSTGASAKEAEGFISHGKTTNAYLDLIENRGPRLVIAYAPGKQVEESLSEHGNNLIIKPIGRDALVFMKNEGNPVDSLSQAQVTSIYSGKLTNWKELGGKQAQIRAFQRPQDSGSQNLMEQLAMKGIPMAEAPAEYVPSEMGELLERVSAYDNTAEALGYSVYFYAKNMYQKPRLRFMAIDGVEPSSKTIRDGSYPYVSDFYAAVRKDELKDSYAYQLFEWLTSDDGQALINGLGYVGIRDEKKALPELLDENTEIFTAEIPLSKGKVILASGRHLYGESGIGVFDQNMKLLKFIRYLDSPDINPFIECRADAILPMQDTLSSKWGLYSLKKEGWVCQPEYDQVFSTKDGFGLKILQEASNEEDSWQITYDFTDLNGKITQAGVSDKEINIDTLLPDSEKYGSYDKQMFIEQYPEILERHKTDESALTIAYTPQDHNIACIEADNVIYYYNMDGTLLLSFEKGNLSGELTYIPMPHFINSQMAYIPVFPPDPYPIVFYLYQEQALIKTLISNTSNGRISYIGEHFYTRYYGNYLYIYNYQDQPCAKFLGAYYTDD